MFRLIRRIKNAVKENREISKRRKRINDLSLRIRLLESELLDPEFGYMKINKDGYLIHGWPIPMAMSMTKDKVAGASFDYSYKMMDKFPGMGWVPAYIAINEIYQRVGRRKVFSDKKIENCMKEDNVGSCDEVYEYLDSIRKEWNAARVDKIAEIKRLRNERMLLVPEAECTE